MFEPAGTVALSLSDAGTMGIESGMPVSVISRRGRVAARAVVSDDVQDGVAKMVARGGGESPAAVLEQVFDPASKVPEEICAVRIEKL